MNQFIKNVNTKKLLGIFIDNNLDWKEQVDHICKNINSRLFSASLNFQRVPLWV
jgi:hypothetical protein